jgi:TetR/AcrR family transcriptional regulator, lmrAB and yxaGH operons repressor
MSVTTTLVPTRERLVRAGVELFQAKGYHGVGINEILEAAAAPKGSFYHHFPGGKEQLAAATLSWLQGEVTGYLDGLAADRASAAEMAAGVARHAVEGVRKRPRGSLLTVLTQDAAPDSEAVAEAARRYADAVRTRLAEARGGDEAFADEALAMILGAAVIARLEGRAERAGEIVGSWLERRR